MDDIRLKVIKIMSETGIEVKFFKKTLEEKGVEVEVDSTGNITPSIREIDISGWITDRVTNSFKRPYTLDKQGNPNIVQIKQIAQSLLGYARKRGVVGVEYVDIHRFAQDGVLAIFYREYRLKPEPEAKAELEDATKTGTK